MTWRLLGELVSPGLAKQLVNAILFPAVTKGHVIAASIVAKLTRHTKITLSLFVTIADTAAVMIKIYTVLGLQFFWQNKILIWAIKSLMGPTN